MDVDVCELHDCFAQNELFSYENLGFCEEGQAERFVDEQRNTYGGDVVVNPSGGCFPRVIHSAQPAWRSAMSSRINCVALPASARSAVRGSACNTMPDWAEPLW